MRLMVLLCFLAGSLVYQSRWHEPGVYASPTPKRVQTKPTKSVVMEYRKVGGVPVQVVTVDMNNPYVRVSVATSERIGRAESVWNLLARSRPTAAITGTYFGSNTKIPVGDLVLEGERVHFGGVGTALCITYDNRVRFVRPPLNRQVSWSDYYTVLGAGPRLLVNGKVSLYPRGEGFRDRRVYARTARTAVGVTKHNKLLMVASRHPMSLRQLAWVMKGLGAKEAIALDGGSSTCLYYRGELKIPPRRPLTNLLVVYEDAQQYEARISRLKPQHRFAKRY